MRWSGMVVASLCMAVAAVAAGAAPEGAPEGAPDGAEARPYTGPLLSVYHAPLEDPGAGRLYEPTSRLLEAARDMPERIELPEPQPQPLPRVEEPPAPVEPVDIPEPPEEEWTAVVDGPVVEPAELAYVYYMAERYSEAALLYERLHEKDPNDRHVAIMLLLSHRNAGHEEEEARELLEDLRADTSAAEWAEWMEQMQELEEPLTQEAQ